MQRQQQKRVYCLSCCCLPLMLCSSFKCLLTHRACQAAAYPIDSFLFPVPLALHQSLLSHTARRRSLPRHSTTNNSSNDTFGIGKEMCMAHGQYRKVCQAMHAHDFHIGSKVGLTFRCFENRKPIFDPFPLRLETAEIDSFWSAWRVKPTSEIVKLF